jgi:hypothetical protein
MAEKVSIIKRAMVLVFFAVLVSTNPAAGKVIYVDDSATGGNEGTSWVDAYNFLQDALADANLALKPVEIRVAQGIYTPDQGADVIRGNSSEEFQLINDVKVLGGFAGIGAMDPNVRSIETYKTILSGDLGGDNANGSYGRSTEVKKSYYILRGNDTNETAVLDGVTITGGRTGIRNWDGSPSITNCRFINAVDGIENINSTQRLSNCAFEGLSSKAVNQSGGSLTLINCEFAGNTGYAIYFSSIGELTLCNCSFVDNDVKWSWMINCSSHGSMRMFDCEFRNNVVGSFAGIQANLSEEFVVENCIFSGNIGVLIDNWSKETFIYNCVFAGNIGDAIHHSKGSIAASNCLFAGIRGRAIDSFGEYLIIKNCTFSGNFSDRGGSALDIQAGSKVSNCIFSKCIFWDNSQPVIKDLYEKVVVDYCNVEGGWPGEGNIEVDPYFVSPGYWDQNNTHEETDDDFWVEGDYHLQSQAGRWDSVSEDWVIDDVTSPCIDAGDPNSPIGTEPFPNGGRVNMGAYGASDKASKSYFDGPVSDVIIAGDINGDGIVDDDDLVILNSHWMMRWQDFVNQSPTVRLIEPQEGDRIAWPGPTTFRAEASDADGQVDKVHFYVQYKFLNGNTNTYGFESRYGSDGWEQEFTWPEDFEFGEYTAWAEATDNEGVVGTSPVIKVILYSP